ncbi:hypothetical protein BGZ99_002421 [Dissophora globulifera]|uniref:Uncharacterized protein n=1 Tax=Dissophora globulifera TaxID=979702 RepID=A0A9P6RRW9_9FUNG|nr:hypothetical protein BGZ99_002421 [Dissophora globulifera]
MHLSTVNSENVGNSTSITGSASCALNLSTACSADSSVLGDRVNSDRSTTSNAGSNAGTSGAGSGYTSSSNSNKHGGSVR